MAGRWRFKTWPQGQDVELVDVFQATPDERRAALAPGPACWLLAHAAPRDAARTAAGFELRWLLRNIAGSELPVTSSLAELRGLLEGALRARRLLAVTKPSEGVVFDARQVLEKEAPLPPEAARDSDRPSYLSYPEIEAAPEYASYPEVEHGPEYESHFEVLEAD